eukprot:TRINITY_DN3885_c0_g1_i9.p1 TRINITY_DN3885_c0_g1~~TRINITY_DN3885_c0_g1_i9.p1  ORF type:complete len:386 (-),score=79.51 TRINITY_DN3885_c0_g1_i9:83-1240(-)
MSTRKSARTVGKDVKEKVKKDEVEKEEEVVEEKEEETKEVEAKEEKGKGKGKGKAKDKGKEKAEEPKVEQTTVTTVTTTEETTTSDERGTKRKIEEVVATTSSSSSSSGPRSDTGVYLTVTDGPAVGPNQIKIISWNVAGYKSVSGKGFADYVKKENPDILCLQETKIEEARVVKDALPPGYETFWYHAVSPNAGYSGTAIFSKTAPIKVTKGLGKKSHDDEGRAITAEFPTFFLVNTYVPNSGRGLPNLKYRVNEWDKDLLAHLKSLESKGKPVIWCGDLNVAHLDIDIKNRNPKLAGFTPEERQSFTDILNAGFVDTYRHFYPTVTGSYTFWAFMGGARGKDVGWRLDYFIVSKSIIGRIHHSFIRKTVMGSDHAPIGIILDV